MEIFQKEIDDGLGEILQANCLSYFSQAKLYTPEESKAVSRVIAGKTITANDLYYINTILATTGWNLNTDIFDPTETWNALGTPTDKPLNLEHNQHEIIGHIVDSSAADFNLNEIPDTTPIDAIPDQFHVLSSAVIYKIWEDPVYAAKIDKIIQEIKNNEWYVSMECVFNGFDYGVIGPDGEKSVIARNEDTSFLTKHLRQYKGTGTYDGNSIGRVMRNIRFIGKGLVRRPGNPNSIIFSHVDEFNKPSQTAVYINHKSSAFISLENKSMDDVLKAQIADLHTEVTSLKAERDSLKAEVATHNSNTFKSKADSLEKTVAELTEKLSVAEKKCAEVDKKANDYEAKMKQMFKDKAKSTRFAALLEAKVEAKEAELMVADFEDVSDEAFLKIVSRVAKSDAMSPNVPDASTVVPVDHFADIHKLAEYIIKYLKAPGSGATVTNVQAEEALDTAKPVGDATTSAVASTDEQVESTRASIEDFLAGKYIKSLKSNKE